MKTYYELLQVAPSATSAQIKQAFRQIIARYHPDKVQHLGAEFQDLAQRRSAELTAAYKTLVDPARRAEYDTGLGIAAGSGEDTAQPAVPSDERAPMAPPVSDDRPDVRFEALRRGRDAVLKRAALARVDQLFAGAFAASERPRTPGFDLSCLSKPRLFDRARLRPWLLAKFVARLDKETVQQAFAQAARANAARKASVAVFLLAGEMAGNREVADVISAAGRPAAAHPIVIIPVDVRDWRAWIPNDADPAVRSLAVRLRTA